jgi:hypothetical protein
METEFMEAIKMFEEDPQVPRVLKGNMWRIIELVSAASEKALELIREDIHREYRKRDDSRYGRGLYGLNVLIDATYKRLTRQELGNAALAAKVLHDRINFMDPDILLGYIRTRMGMAITLERVKGSIADRAPVDVGPSPILPYPSGRSVYSPPETRREQPTVGPSPVPSTSPSY